MSAEEPSVPSPYTGRRAGDADELAAERPAGPAGPRIRWRRITLVHLLAGAAMGFAVPGFFFLASGFLTSNVVYYLPILLLSAAVVSLIAGGFPLLVAWLTWLIVSRAGRGRWREVVAVAGGALIGSAPISVLGAGAFNSWEPTLYIGLFFGVPSAIGLAIWVLVAWRRMPVATATPADSLN